MAGNFRMSSQHVAGLFIRQQLAKYEIRFHAKLYHIFIRLLSGPIFLSVCGRDGLPELVFITSYEWQSSAQFMHEVVVTTVPLWSPDFWSGWPITNASSLATITCAVHFHLGALEKKCFKILCRPSEHFRTLSASAMPTFGGSQKNAYPMTTAVRRSRRMSTLAPQNTSQSKTRN